MAIKPGSAEYYEIWCNDSLWTYLQRLKEGYLPFLTREKGEAGTRGGFYIEWRRIA